MLLSSVGDYMIFLLRGAPRAGKSTWIQNNLLSREDMKDDVQVFSADKYHMVGTDYCDDPKRARFAHNECFKEYVRFCLYPDKTGIQEYCVVDNTNTTLWELSPYVKIAESFGLNYEIIYVMCTLEQSIMRNIHNVPHNTILQMHRNLQTEIVPPHWKHRIVLPNI